MYQQEWKDIPTWEGIYQVSNFGRIKRLKGGKVKQDQIHLGKDAGKGYLRFVLSKGKRKERWDVHVLVATVFQRPPVEGEDCHHKNQMKCCNCVWNIEIKESGQHNSEHKTGQVSPNKGKKASEQTRRKQSESRNKYYERLRQNGQKLTGHKRTKESILKGLETKRQRRVFNPNYGKRRKNINNTESQFNERTV